MKNTQVTCSVIMFLCIIFLAGLSIANANRGEIQSQGDPIEECVNNPQCSREFIDLLCEIDNCRTAIETLQDSVHWTSVNINPGEECDEAWDYNDGLVSSASADWAICKDGPSPEPPTEWAQTCFSPGVGDSGVLLPEHDVIAVLPLPEGPFRGGADCVAEHLVVQNNCITCCDGNPYCEDACGAVVAPVIAETCLGLEK